MADPPWILGVSYSHNGAACLLRGDELVVAIQEERLTGVKRARIRHHQESLAVRYCLDVAGIRIDEVDLLAVCAFSGPSAPPLEWPGAPPGPLPRHYLTLPHHLGHAHAVFATSGFEAAAILIVDGQGGTVADLPPGERTRVVHATVPGQERETEVISLYAGDRDGVRLLEKHGGEFMPGWSARPAGAPRSMARFGSLGGMYSAAADLIFGDPLEAGKVMGLAPFGRAIHPASDFFTIDAEGAFHYRDDVPARYRDLAPWPDNQDRFGDLAASVQAALEAAILQLAERSRRLAGQEIDPAENRLCYAGGVALNSIANERLHAELGFDDIYVMPAAEDSGPAIGAAYFGLAALTGRGAHRRLAHDSVGRSYDAAAIERAIAQTPRIEPVATDDIVETVVDRLCAGDIIGWFHGRSELGPRALGQRSILCDARHPDAKARLNDRVKHREPFRPFAPALPADAAGEWFVVPSRFPASPAMLRVWPFQPGRAEQVPAAAHVDGTGRAQTVTAADVPALHRLLVAYAARTGVPILVNTSFNIAGEPIVETPEDALWCLLATDLDAVVLEGRLVRKAAAHRSILDLVPRLVAHHVEIRFAVEAGALRLRVPADAEARIATTTPYGELVHAVTGGDTHLLAACDGTRTGWDILDALHRAQAVMTETALVRRLCFYRRGNVLALTSPPSAGAGSRSAPP